MMSGTLTAAARTMRGTLSGADGEFHGVSTDTRTIRPGELFVALRGPNFDGNDFVEAAAGRRAAAAVVTGAVDASLPRISVEDTLDALGRLAADWRQRMPARIVGITGSNGKTTLKELVASCLRLDAATLATDGNLNNEIGVPLMLARLEASHRFAVLEMGANHAGEIAYLTGLVAPDVVAITNAAEAHLEGFGSVEGVAHAKGEILAGDPRPSAAILNADDPYFELWRSLAADIPVVSFGVKNDAADVRATGVRTTDSGSAFTLTLRDAAIDVTLPLAGAHNVLNAAAAAAIVSVLGMPAELIKRGLEAVEPVAGRLRPLVLAGGATLFDDSYNANPASVIAAAGFLAAQPGDGWMILGDMAELGEGAPDMHADVGRRIAGFGVDRLFATGPLSRHTVAAFGDAGRWFEDIDSLIDSLTRELNATTGVSLLVKGSRSTRMERVVRALTAGQEG